MSSKNKNNKEDDFLEKLKRHIKDMKEFKQKREKVKNMIQERKKKENVAYDFQLQDNKKYHDKDFNERQEECSELFNPMKVWENIEQNKEDIEKSAENGKKKLNDLENRIKEEKEKENINYTFQLQDNKKYHDKIEKDFHEKQEKSLKLFNPIKAWNNGYFLTQHKKDIEKSAEKGKKKLEKVKNMIQERKKEENIKDYTLKPQFLKPFRHIRLKSSNNKDSYLQIYQNKVFNKKNKLQKKFKPIIKKYTSSTNAVNYYHKHTNDPFNNKTSYVDKYFDFNKNNCTAKKNIDVFSRLYQDAKDRKVRLKKLADTIYRKNANIDNKTQNKNLRNFSQNRYKRK